MYFGHFLHIFSNPVLNAYSRVLLFVVLAAGMPLGAWSGECPSQLGRWGGYSATRAVAVSGEHVFFGGSAIRVADISQPGEPRVVAAHRLDHNLVDLESSTDILLAAAGNVLVFDITNPEQPLEKSEISIPPYSYEAKAVALNATHGFAAFAYEGQSSHSRLLVLDLSNLAAPEEVASLLLAGRCRTMSVSNSLALVATNVFFDGDGVFHPGGVRIVDISIPSLPEEVGFFTVDATQPPGPEALAIIGDHAVLAYGEYGLRVINIANPALPVEVAAFEEQAWSPSSVTISGTLAFVGNPASGQQSFRIFDIADPQNPALVGELPDLAAFDSAITGNWAMVAASVEGIRVVDVSDSTMPTDQGFSSPAREAERLAATDTHIFISSPPCGLYVVDALSATDPTEVASLPFSGFSGPIEFTSGYLMLGVFGDDQVSRLHIVDVSSPSQPTEIGNLEISSPAYAMTGVGNLMLVSTHGDCLLVVDISDPQLPQVVGSWDPGGFGYTGGLTMADETTLLITYQDFYQGMAGLYAIDISDPNLPTLLDYMPLLNPYDVKAQDHLAYVADSPGIVVVDISDPTELSETGFAGRVHGTETITVEINGQIGYSIETPPEWNEPPPPDHDWVMVTWDLSNPTAPAPSSWQPYNLGQFDGGFDPLALVGQRVFLAARWSGVRVFDPSWCSPLFIFDDDFESGDSTSWQ